MKFSSILILFLLFSNPIHAIEINFENDSLRGSLGDVIAFSWRIPLAPGDSLSYRLDSEDTQGIEILRDEIIPGKNESRIHFETAVYDSVGPYQFPDVMIYRHTETTLDSFRAQGPLLEIYSILTPADSSFRDIKGLQRIPTRFNWWILLWVFAAGIVIWLLLKIPRFRRMVVKDEEPNVPIIPPEEAHLTALRELEHLRRSKLLSLHQFKEFHSSLTHIIKHYLERRYLIDTLDLTTYELMNELENLSEVSEEIQAKIKTILETADLIKFAKAQSNELESGNDLSRAVDIVEKTKIENDMGDDT